MDQEKVMFGFKCLAALVIAVLFFTILVPKYRQLDDFITTKTKEFLGVILNTTAIAGKRSRDYAGNYTEAELANTVFVFEGEVFSCNNNEQLSILIKKGKFILRQIPKDLNIRQKVAFLFYMNGEFAQAIEYYNFVLDNVPKRKRTFEKLHTNRDYRSIKRVLLELTALYYDLDEREKMIVYYKQFLKVAYRDEIYREHISGGISDENIRYGIFSKFGASGLLQYKKSNTELEKYLKTSPGETAAILDLAKNNFEVVNLFFDNPPDDYLDFVNNAQKYLELALDFASEYKKKAITKDLSHLLKLKEKYLVKINYAEQKK